VPVLLNFTETVTIMLNENFMAWYDSRMQIHLDYLGKHVAVFTIKRLIH